MDPTNPNIVYGESQGGGIERVNVATGESVGLSQAERPGADRGVGRHRSPCCEEDSVKAATPAVKKRIARYPAR